MKSIRKAALLMAVAAAAIAVTAPAAANAATLKINGVYATYGQTIVGTSTNLTFQSYLGKWACEKVTVSAMVTRNDGSVVEAVENAPGIAEGCKVGANPVPLKPSLKAFKLEGTGAGILGLRLEYKIGAVECIQESAASPITYTPGTNAMKVTNMQFKATPAGCGSLYANGGFGWTSPGGKVVFD